MRARVCLAYAGRMPLPRLPGGVCSEQRPAPAVAAAAAPQRLGGSAPTARGRLRVALAAGLGVGLGALGLPCGAVVRATPVNDAAARADAANPGSTRVLLAISGRGALQHLPLLLAEQFGWFAEAGLDVEVSDLPSQARVAQALASGAADFACGPFDQLLVAPSRAPATQAFVLLCHAPQVALGYSTRALPGRPAVADLRGRKLGIAAPGTASHLMAQHVLLHAGLSSSDVSFISVGSATGAMAALRSGQIDALCHGEPVLTQLLQRGELRLEADGRTTAGTQQVFGGVLPSACLYSNAETLQRKAAVAQALSHTTVRALRWLRTVGARDLMRAVPESHLFGDRGVYLEAFQAMRETFSADGLMPEDGPRTALKAHLRFDSALRADTLDLARTYTNEFSRRARERAARTDA